MPIDTVFAFLLAVVIPALVLAAAYCLRRVSRYGRAVARQLDELFRLTQGQAVELAALRRDLEALRKNAGAGATAARDISAIRTEIAGARQQLAVLVEQAARMDAAVPRRPQPTVAARSDSAFPAGMSDQDLVAMAESLAVLRPLLPYPGWRFDAVWTNPDPAIVCRRRIWEEGLRRKLEAPVLVPWHGSTRLRLCLGNDLSRQIFISGCIDPNEFLFLDRYLVPGMTFVDAGANEGAYTVFAAHRVGPEGVVWAFEPSPREVRRLRANLELNRLDVRVFPSALADASGQATLAVACGEHAGQNTLGVLARGVEPEGAEPVPLVTLDSVLASYPLARLDFIKADVEGAEYRLLRGAAATLQRFRPVLLLEVSDEALHGQGCGAAQLLDHLHGLEYRWYRFDPATGLPAPAEPGSFADNMLAVPAEKQLPERVRSLGAPPASHSPNPAII